MHFLLNRNCLIPVLIGLITLSAGCSSPKDEIERLARDVAEEQAREVARDRAAVVAQEAAEKLVRESLPDTVNNRLHLVGKWRNSANTSTDTYMPDGTYYGEIDDVVELPLDETGFIGIVTVKMVGTVSGTWSIDGDQLSVVFTDVDNLKFSDVSLKRTKASKINVDLALLQEKIATSFQEDLASQFLLRKITMTIVSVTDEKLCTKSEDGEVTVATRVSTR